MVNGDTACGETLTAAKSLRRIVILGAGGHARVIADAILSLRALGREIDLVGFLDDDSARHNQVMLGRPILGSTADLNKISRDEVIVGIGDNELRQRLFDELQLHGETLATIVHPQAIIARDVRIGVGTVVFAGVVVNTCARIGDNVILNTACTIGHDTTIGSHVHIGTGVHITGGVHVGEGAFVGVGSVIIPNTSVGEWARVGGGGVVIRDVPSRVTVVGVPTRRIRDHP